MIIYNKTVKLADIFSIHITLLPILLVLYLNYRSNIFDYLLSYFSVASKVQESSQALGFAEVA